MMLITVFLTMAAWQQGAPERAAKRIETAQYCRAVEQRDRGREMERITAPVGGDVKEARLIHEVIPAYPPAAKERGLTGEVTITAEISAEGRVERAQIVMGARAFRKTALGAVRQWRYEPATLDGRPVAEELWITLRWVGGER
jgi:TonB family protein